MMKKVLASVVLLLTLLYCTVQLHYTATLSWPAHVTCTCYTHMKKRQAEKCCLLVIAHPPSNHTRTGLFVVIRQWQLKGYEDHRGGIP